MANENDREILPLEQGHRFTPEEIARWTCHDCGTTGAYVLKERAELLVRVDTLAVLVPVEAAVCDVCGATLIDAPNCAKLDDAQHVLEALEQGGTLPATWRRVGTIYRIG